MDDQRSLFLTLICILLGVGIVMVHSASITSWPTEYEQVYLSKHLLFLAIGAAVLATCATLPPTTWFRFAPAFFCGSLLLLVLVLLPGVGTKVNGAQRWLRAGGFSLQPSELAKIALTLLVVRILVTQNRTGQRPWLKTIGRVLIPVGLVVPLVLVEPDLGAAAFLTCCALIALFLAGLPIRYFVMSILLLVPTVGILIAFKPYQAARVAGFLQTWQDVNQAPWQLKQSILSLGAGGLWGTGVGRGSQKLSFLPEANTDFVFAVVGEELGLVGTLTVLLTWCGVFVVGIRIARQKLPGSFERIAATTLLTQIVLQAALNVAVVTAMVPPKGFAHPLLSYGGSNLVTSLAAFGVILGLTRAPAVQPQTVAAQAMTPSVHDSSRHNSAGDAETQEDEEPTRHGPAITDEVAECADSRV